MLLVPKKLKIDFELFANSGTNAMTVVVYFAMANYAKDFCTQQIRKTTAQKIAREVVFLLSGSPVDVHNSITTLINDSMIVDDGNGYYVFVDLIR